ncbi:F-box protein [Striga hermonthica]|uniref:F-box protein n=1 Tax=Striga hermonthica TaxID=68872 RepID=A0A9N7N1J1_STRHE|nr:F-box protein [Striga hermonthica]
MSYSPEKPPAFNPGKTKKKAWSWPEPVSSGGHGPNEALKHAVLKMRLQPISKSGSTTPHSESEPESDSSSFNPPAAAPDYISLLSDELLLRVFGKIPDTKQHVSNCLVCRRWCLLCGKLVRSVRLLDWEFLESGRLTFRFPNLVDIDIVPACIKSERNSGVLLSTKLLGVYVNSSVLECNGFFVQKRNVLDCAAVDEGLRILSKGARSLRRAVLINFTEEGLSCLAEECELLQELELHYCGDFALKGIHKCRNLQVLKLIGRLNGVYDSTITDIGLTILAQECRRLVKLELVGCEGSYDGIKAIGVCCPMLEELTLGDHRMEGGWLSALPFCGNLKTLRIESCRFFDENPGPDKHIGFSPMLEELHLSRCQMRDKGGIWALFLACQIIRELVIEDCWGLDDNIFSAATVFRSIKSLSLEGCSLLTTEGLELVVLSLKDLRRLKVISCNNVRDSEITPELALLFSNLKELKWRPDSKSMLTAGLIEKMATGGGAPQRGTAAAAAANLRRRRTAGGGGAAGGGAGGTMLQFYTDDAPGLKISPNVVLVMSIGFIAFVAILHVVGKLYFVRKE